jgi:pimeloyl-ACP methyl ester carboxylesterase
MSTNPFDFVSEYWTDALQRWVLTLDVLRQRGNTYNERRDQIAPNVLHFKAELVLDGRTLPRPVNYVLVLILPAEGTTLDPAKRPFVVFDPRAGHGPGIGGMKQDSEIGVARAEGHPCYFVGFLPEPMPGQTIEDVCRAEAAFLEEVIRRHPEAEGKPAIVANCQAGWQMMMTAAMRPELCGPIVLAGSPLSYWAGVHGKNPMRYLGGVLGGTWMTALAGDIGHGKFDGANLVANFEQLNPANTLWEKPYGLYSRVDTEAPRFLDFETWWGSPVILNAEEMQWIADNLFVGNRLSTGQLRTTDGARIDLRNIESPIVVFSSWGDNITPPQQALGWILDLYDDESEIVAAGQTIVYTTHQTIGHLGIFVSGKVATREHAEFANCMDMIDLMPPGLYEAVITEVGEDTANVELVNGRYLFRLEARTLDHIRAFGGNDAEDERRFEAAARVSDVNLGLYRTVAQPAVKAMASEQTAEMARELHPNRLRFAMFSDRNPMMAPVKGIAEDVRRQRKPVGKDNPLLALETMTSSWITTWLDSYRLARDAMTEATFLATYGSPLLQAFAGQTGSAAQNRHHIERDLNREAAAASARVEIESLFERGGVIEAIMRALVYVRAATGTVDERGFGMLKAARAARPAEERLHLADLKKLIREQYLVVRLDEARAIRALPLLLAGNNDRQAAFDVVRRVAVATGPLSEDEARRLHRVQTLFLGGSLTEAAE